MGLPEPEGYPERTWYGANPRYPVGVSGPPDIIDCAECGATLDESERSGEDSRLCAVCAVEAILGNVAAIIVDNIVNEEVDEHEIVERTVELLVRYSYLKRCDQDHYHLGSQPDCHQCAVEEGSMR